MTIFAIMMPTVAPALVQSIREQYPSDHFELTETQWLVSSKETAITVSNRLGITGDSPSTGNAVVFATTSYFGRAPATVWDWIKVKLEATGG